MSMLPVPFDGSIALFRKVQNDRSSWLGTWNNQHKEFRFVIANRLEKESYRECLSREIAWQLDLERDRDYLISSVARLHFATETATIKFYVVDMYGKKVLKKLKQDTANRWLARHELVNQQTDDGRPICPELCELIFRADVIPFDQPS